MARRKGRPRRLAPAPKEGPDRKSLVKYVDFLRGKRRAWVRSRPRRHTPRAATRAAALAGEAGVAQGSGAQAVGAPTTCMVGLRVAAGTSERHVFRPPPGSACASPHALSRVSRMLVCPGRLPLLGKRHGRLAVLQ